MIEFFQGSRLREKRRSVVTSLLSVFLVIFLPPQSSASTDTQVCLKAPYAVEIAFAYVNSEKSRWEVDGWWKINPGRCLDLKASANSEYYLYAKVRPDDYIAAHLDGLDSEWSGDVDSTNSVQICVPTSRGFNRSPDICVNGDAKKQFVHIQATGEQYTYELTLWESEWELLGFRPNSLEDVRQATASLRRQMEYTDYLEQEPLGTPYRLGLVSVESENGVFVRETIPGMPGDGVFQPGDRIVSVGGVQISSSSDLTYELQQIGYGLLPKNRFAKIIIDRSPNRYEVELTPCFDAASFCLAYFKFLDPRVQANAAKAFVRGTVGGVLWGFDGELYCMAKAIKQAYEEVPSDQRDRTCVKRLRHEREELIETHEATMQWGDLGGSLTSPRIVWRALARKSAQRSARNIAVGALDEAMQGGLSYVGKLSSTEEFSMQQAAEEIAIGAGLGATVTAITGH